MSVVISAFLLPVVSNGETHTDTLSNPSKKGGSIAPLLKKFAEITVPVFVLIVSGDPLLGGTAVPVTTNSHDGMYKAVGSAKLMEEKKDPASAREVSSVRQNVFSLLFTRSEQNFIHALSQVNNGPFNEGPAIKVPGYGIAFMNRNIAKR